MKEHQWVTGDRQLFQKLAHNSAKLGLRPRNSLHGESALYEVFHENTKLGRLSARAHSAWAISFTRSHPDRTLRACKVYRLRERRELPQVRARTELERTIKARRSIRVFSDARLGLEELARLLVFAYGITDPLESLRAVASGGALYPLELYVTALELNGLDPNVYHY